MKYIKLTIIGVLSVLFCGCEIFLDLHTDHPSDSVLIKNFEDFEDDFEMLARMAAEDSEVVRIDHDFTWTKNNATWPRPESELGFSFARWAEYRRLFDKLGLESGILNFQPDYVFLIASSKGMVSAGSSKGYAYKLQTPSPLVESLDDFSESTRKSATAYKRLKDNWYLVYQSSG